VYPLSEATDQARILPPSNFPNWSNASKFQSHPSSAPNHLDPTVWRASRPLPWSKLV
jgi:hypothetical protein